jgi:hypothetical protein
MTTVIILTAIATLILQYLYKEVKYRYEINQQFKEAELLDKIDKRIEYKLKQILKENE